MTSEIRKHLVTVIDAPAATQDWVDQFIEAARSGLGDWPHPHDGIVRTVIPLARFDAVMTQVGWARTTEGTIPLDPVPDPDNGSIYHNVLHGLLGDFH